MNPNYDRALSQLVRLASEDSDVIADLVSLIGQGDSLPLISSALASQGERALHPLMALLEDGSPDEQLLAAVIISQIDSSRVEVIPFLIEGLEDRIQDPQMNRVGHEIYPSRRTIVESISRFGQKGHIALPAILKGLLPHSSPYSEVELYYRQEALATIGRIGFVSAEVLDVLLCYLNDDNLRLKSSVITAIGALDLSTQEPFFSSLIDLLLGGEPCGSLAGRTLAETLDPKVIPIFVKALQHPSSAVRVDAAKALGHLGTLAEDATQALLNALNDIDSLVRLNVVTALAAVGVEQITSIELLVQALNDYNPIIRAKTLELFVQMGPRAKTAIPFVQDALLDPNASVRQSAIDALVAISESAYH